MLATFLRQWTTLLSCSSEGQGCVRLSTASIPNPVADLSFVYKNVILGEMYGVVLYSLVVGVVPCLTDNALKYKYARFSFFSRF